MKLEEFDYYFELFMKFPLIQRLLTRYPDIDPIATGIGPIEIHWYALMYLVAFAAGGLLGRYRLVECRGMDEHADLGSRFHRRRCGAGVFCSVIFCQHRLLPSASYQIFWVWTGGHVFSWRPDRVVLAVIPARSQYAFEWLIFLRHFVRQSPAGRMATSLIRSRGAVMMFPGRWCFLRVGRCRDNCPSYMNNPEGIILFVVVWSFAAKPGVSVR